MHSAKFAIGQIVRHRLFGYRGVIFDADPRFLGTDEWYQQMARSQPPKDKPWYRVLVHGSVQETYVAERNLQRDDCNEPIDHPLVEAIFDAFHDGVYRTERRPN
jgi:heat shock protein HspQ